MSNKLAKTEQGISQEVLNKLMIEGDLSKFSESQLLEYYAAMCARYGLDPISRPFDVVVLKGRKVMYANKTCAAQVTVTNQLTVAIIDKAKHGDVFTVTARATRPDGGYVDDMGAVAWPTSPMEQADAILKAATKAKRRAVFAAVGLGMLSQEEVQDIPDAEIVEVPIVKLDDAVTTWCDALDAADVDEFVAAHKQIVKTFAKGGAELNAIGKHITSNAARLGLRYNKGEWQHIIDRGEQN